MALNLQIRSGLNDEEKARWSKMLEVVEEWEKGLGDWMQSDLPEAIRTSCEAFKDPRPYLTAKYFWHVVHDVSFSRAGNSPSNSDSVHGRF